MSCISRPWSSRPSSLLLIFACLLASLRPAAAVAQISEDQYSFLRYNDNFSALGDSARRTDGLTQLKYLPLGATGDYLTFGGDDRERFDAYQNPSFGKTGVPQDTTHLHRLLLHANLQLQDFRLFFELGSEIENGRLPRATPTDIDRLDVAQAFIDYRLHLSDTAITVRVGREELLYGEGLLIGPRDGPNIREDWDGVRVIALTGMTQIDVLAVRPVNDLPGLFDDDTSAQQALWGIYSASHFPDLKNSGFDAYALSTETDGLALSDGKGTDHRTSVGMRLYGHAQALDATLEAIGQFGTFSDRNVLAYAFHSEAGVTGSGLWSTPRVGLKFDDLSGNRNRFHGTEGSFFPISPNLTYSTEATIEGASNLRQAGVVFGIEPAADASLTYEVEGLWRDSTSDAFYLAPQIPLFQPGGANTRFTGTEQQLEGIVRLNAFLQIKAALVHFQPGAFVTSQHGHAINYAMLTGAVRF